MKTIKKEIYLLTEIKKSKFITYLLPVKNKEEVKEVLDDIRNEHLDANHCCFAYVLNEEYKCSDDGEPSGTAGLPILEILLKNELHYILVVVVRYFGGIKLGAGGLIRAYSKATRDAVLNSEIQEMVLGYNVKINISYEEQKQLEYLLKPYQIISQEFSETICYEVLIPIENISIINTYSYQIINELWIMSKKKE